MSKAKEEAKELLTDLIAGMPHAVTIYLEGKGPIVAFAANESDIQMAARAINYYEELDKLVGQIESTLAQVRGE